MDNSAVISFSSRTAQDIVENLQKSLRILVVLKEGLTTSSSATSLSTPTPTSGGEGVKKFESLCRGIVSSVQVRHIRIREGGVSQK